MAGRVWLDADADGLQDSGERNLPGSVVVRLYVSDDDVADPQNDQLVERVRTNGEFVIDYSLLAGQWNCAYVVVTDLLNGMVITQQNVLTPAAALGNSQVNAAGFSDTFLIGDGPQLDLDIGVRRPHQQVQWNPGDGRVRVTSPDNVQPRFEVNTRIPELKRWNNVEAIDVNGDGWLDLVGQDRRQQKQFVSLGTGKGLETPVVLDPSRQSRQ